MMKNVEKDVVLDEVVKELSRKYNRKEKVINAMFIKCFELGYSIENSQKHINEFCQNNINCYIFFCANLFFSKLPDRN